VLASLVAMPEDVDAPTPMAKLVTVKRAAEALSLTPRTLRARRKHFPSAFVGRGRGLRVDLDALLVAIRASNTTDAERDGADLVTRRHLRRLTGDGRPTSDR
jgi:hypothetical protein